MSDMIDRKEAVEAIKNEMLSWLEGDSHDYRKVVDAIMDLPTVDAEPVRRGKWIYGEDEYGDDGYFCSVCHGHEMWKYGTEPIDFIEAYHYCPFCGAKMDKRKE